MGFVLCSNKSNRHLRLEIPTVAKLNNRARSFQRHALCKKYLTIYGLEFLVHFSKYCSCFAKTTANTAVPNQQTVEAIVGILAKLSYRKAWKPAGLEIADSIVKALRNGAYKNKKALFCHIYPRQLQPSETYSHWEIYPGHRADIFQEEGERTASTCWGYSPTALGIHRNSLGWDRPINSINEA